MVDREQHRDRPSMRESRAIYRLYMYRVTLLHVYSYSELDLRAWTRAWTSRLHYMDAELALTWRCWCAQLCGARLFVFFGMYAWMVQLHRTRRQATLS